MTESVIKTVAGISDRIFQLLISITIKQFSNNVAGVGL